MAAPVSGRFELVSEYAPQGDQPRAIDRLVEGVSAGLANQTLLGVTGSGKSFTMACVVEKMNRPALVMAPNKTLAAQLYAEFKELFPENATTFFDRTDSPLARTVFERDVSGAVVAQVYRAQGQELRAWKLP